MTLSINIFKTKAAAEAKEQELIVLGYSTELRGKHEHVLVNDFVNGTPDCVFDEVGKLWVVLATK
jgi:hypothetical protein